MLLDELTDPNINYEYTYIYLKCCQNCGKNVKSGGCCRRRCGGKTPGKFVIVCLLFCLHTYADATAALHAASGGLKIIRQLYFFAGWPKYKQLLEIIFFASLFYRSLVGMGVPQAHMVGPLS